MTGQRRSRIQVIKFIPGIAWFLFSVILLFLPGEDVPKEPGWLKIPDFDKIAHATLFGGIVFWFCMPYKNSLLTPPGKQHLFIKIAIATIVWGITTEFIQKFFIEGRQFDLVDWVADSIGAVIAFFISRKFFLNPKPV